MLSNLSYILHDTGPVTVRDSDPMSRTLQTGPRDSGVMTQAPSFEPWLAGPREVILIYYLLCCLTSYMTRAW